MSCQTHYTIYLKTYSGCQLDCAHCMTNGKRGGKDSFPLLETQDWFRRLDAYLPKHVGIHVELHGGEPLLAPLDDLISIRDYLRSLDRDISIGITTNLVLNLTGEVVDFLKSLDGVGTSWDSNIRFSHPKQRQLWLANVRYLVPQLKNSTLNISLSRDVLESNIDTLLLWVLQLGFDTLSFERITLDGQAVMNQQILPSNREINQWYLRLHHAVERLGLRERLYITNLEDVYVKFERGVSNSGTFCRDCETKLFTLNVDGGVGSCPNTATAETFGRREDEIETLFQRPKRIEWIMKEATRHDSCYECGVFDVCGSDCHQLRWQGDRCPAPRDLMYYLKGLRDAQF